MKTAYEDWRDRADDFDALVEYAARYKNFDEFLANATLEYLKLNLRDNVSSQIPIDVPDKGDYRFHLDVDNDDPQ